MVIDDEVYATKQIDPELRSAVNEIEPSLLIDLKKYALCECILLSELDHPNIVHFFGVSVANDNIVLVMEYLPTSLTSCLEEYENFPPPYKFSILRDACRGLEYLHTYSPPLIHRDISANNIMLTADLRAKLVDVGSARQVGTTKLDGTMSPCPGALLCMPPEALVENNVYDERLDVFSFGNVILHVITQKWPIPLEAADEDEYADREPLYGDREVKVRQLYIREMGEDHSLAEIVVRCLQSDPRDRPWTGEIVAELEPLCMRYPISNPLEMFEMIVALQLQAAHYPMHQTELEPANAQWLVSDLRLSAMKKQAKIKSKPKQNREAVIQEEDGKCIIIIIIIFVGCYVATKFL